ncbi:MAG: class II fructose-1,6-bisphosphate aldolase [Candidatus Bathyarchaeota archaeon]|jgi:fructose-bisphosphate aldolase class II
MLSTNREILASAAAEKYAVGAFNICNLESLQAVVTAAKEENSPVIVAVTPSAIEYAGLSHLAKMVEETSQLVPTPMSLHLDHGKDLETIAKCLDAGFTSIMVDGSHLNFEENIALARDVIGLAHPKGVAVEAELGRLAGVEEVAVEEKDAVLTDPEAAKEFVERTNVDALAVAIGTSHGAYKFRGEPKLDFKRLTEIKGELDVPLVLHGASEVPAWIIEKATRYGAQLVGARGMPDESIKQAIRLGIAKINIDTDLRLAFTATIREILATSPAQFDPRKILGPAREAMKKVAKSKMRLFGSSNKA